MEATIRTVDPSVSFKSVSASRGKAVRAEPISALYEQGKVHHVGRFDALENEMVTWQPEISSWSPNRVDALVWVLTELLVRGGEAVCLNSEDFEELGPLTLREQAGLDWGIEPNEERRNRPRIERPWPSIWEREPWRGFFNE